MESKPYLQEISLKEDALRPSDEFPFTIPAIKNMPTIKFHQDVTFFVGELTES